MTTLYPWLDGLWEQWQPALERGSFSQAVLLSAPNELGVDQLVELLAKTQLCKSSTTEPCGFCHSCDLFDAGTHPDFHTLRPVEAGKSISVDQVRQCQQWAQQSSQLSGTRVIWIENAEAMTESAANALLKSLEEPSASCCYVLTVAKVNQLLPTIISRCQQWVVSIPSHHVAQNWLASQGVKGEYDLALRLASGSPLLAMKLIDDDKISVYQNLESAFLEALQTKSIYSWNDVVKLMADDYERSLIWLWYLMTDAQKQQFSVASTTAMPGAVQLAERVDHQQLYLQTNELVALLKQFHNHSGLNRELLTLDWLMAF
ncbi:DNA polymerase III subunit delta' [Vibrio astriarenae]|uniref:DNA polymerase III subunit delta' n=1 Tax=Vibrio astriarenae TaxID=1481923 RepID=UPI00373551EC